MAHIRSFSVEEPEQDEFKHTFLKVIENFIKELPNIFRHRTAMIQHETRGASDVMHRHAREASPFVVWSIIYGMAVNGAN